MLNIFVSRYESRPTDALFAPADRYVYRIPMPQSSRSSFESRCIGAEHNVYSRTYLNPSLKAGAICPSFLPLLQRSEDVYRKTMDLILALQRSAMCIAKHIYPKSPKVPASLYSFNAASPNNMVKYQNVIGTIIRFAPDGRAVLL